MKKLIALVVLAMSLSAVVEVPDALACNTSDCAKQGCANSDC